MKTRRKEIGPRGQVSIRLSPAGLARVAQLVDYYSRSQDWRRCTQVEVFERALERLCSIERLPPLDGHTDGRAPR